MGRPAATSGARGAWDRRQGQGGGELGLPGVAPGAGGAEGAVIVAQVAEELAVGAPPSTLTRSPSGRRTGDAEREPGGQVEHAGVKPACSSRVVYSGMPRKWSWPPWVKASSLTISSASRRTMVDQQDLVGQPMALETGHQTRQRALEEAGLAVDRDDDRQLGRVLSGEHPDSFSWNRVRNVLLVPGRGSLAAAQCYPVGSPAGKVGPERSVRSPEPAPSTALERVSGG